jgi:hypothetical protein
MGMNVMTPQQPQHNNVNCHTVHLQPQDLFPVCLILFLSIITTVIVLCLLIWALDLPVTYILDKQQDEGSQMQ